MPYDPAKTAQLLTTVAAYQRLPAGEFIQMLAAQLKEAEAMANESIMTIREAKQKTINAEAMLRSEEISHRETAAKLEPFRNALQKIAEGKEKAAKKIALETLNPAPPPDVPLQPLPTN